MKNIIPNVGRKREGRVRGGGSRERGWGKKWKELKKRVKKNISRKIR